MDGWNSLAELHFQLMLTILWLVGKLLETSETGFVWKLPNTKLKHVLKHVLKQSTSADRLLLWRQLNRNSVAIIVSVKLNQCVEEIVSVSDKIIMKCKEQGEIFRNVIPSIRNYATLWNVLYAGVFRSDLPKNFNRITYAHDLVLLVEADVNTDDW